MKRTAWLGLPCILWLACGQSGGAVRETTANRAEDEVAEVRAFLQEAQTRGLALYRESIAAQWDYATDISPENEARAAHMLDEVLALGTELVERARALHCVPGLEPSECRQLELWARSGSLPAPRDPEKRGELSRLMTQMEGAFGSAKVCSEGSNGAKACKTLDELSDIMGESREPQALLEAFEGWREATKDLASPFLRATALANEGARDQRYADLSHAWLSGYDMAPEQAEGLLASLWKEVEPLYRALHCHVRAKLSERYGEGVVPPQGPMPAHVLGNMWAQEWSALYDLMPPYHDQPSLDITTALVEQGYDEKRMTRISERFFTSLGMPELPETFWERSLFARPQGREVVCHASAWDVTLDADVRLKMCVKINQQDLVTLHHELGHLYYYLAYHKLPVVLQDGANDGFHEAIGDTIARSITPSYLSKLGLLEQTSSAPEAVVNQLFKDALDKIAFLPWGYLVDRFRWEAFRSEADAATLQRRWWELRREVQGVVPPRPRPEGAFDPGAKYHVAAGVPYARYFFASVLQFELHRALCERAGHKGPLHQCSIYGSRKAGEALWSLLKLGASRPWPEALAVVTGKRQLDAAAMLQYYEPLTTWLEDQNRDRQCGW